MARRVVWGISARDELREARDYIARDSRRYTTDFVREVLAVASSLSELSERGRPVAWLGEPGLREIRVQSYRLIYRVETDTVGIVALLHAARERAVAWAERPREG